MGKKKVSSGSGALERYGERERGGWGIGDVGRILLWNGDAVVD